MKALERLKLVAALLVLVVTSLGGVAVGEDNPSNPNPKKYPSLFTFGPVTCASGSGCLQTVTDGPSHRTYTVEPTGWHMVTMSPGQ